MAEDGRFFFDVSSALPAGEDVPDGIRRGVLRDVADRVLDAVVAGWPVDTGRSLAGFRVQQTAGGQGFQVVNLVDYAAFVDDGLAERLATAALEASRGWAQEQARKLMARGKLPAGVRQARAVTPRRAVRQLEAGGVPAAATERLAAGDTAGAVRAFARSVETARALEVARTLDLPPPILELVRQGAIRRAVDELVRLGRLADARALRGRLAA